RGTGGKDRRPDEARHGTAHQDRSGRGRRGADEHRRHLGGGHLRRRERPYDHHGRRRSQGGHQYHQRAERRALRGPRLVSAQELTAAKKPAAAEYAAAGFRFPGVYPRFTRGTAWFAPADCGPVTPGWRTTPKSPPCRKAVAGWSPRSLPCARWWTRRCR